MYLNSELILPNNRGTVLHYFSTLKKAYPTMRNFLPRENNEFVLEEDKEAGTRRWATLENKRLGSGCLGPTSFETADEQHLRVLDLAPFHLDINELDTEALDVIFSFDFLYKGNHDEAVAEALGLNSSLDSILNIPGSRVLKFDPNITLSLDDEMKLQCRLSIETRTNAYQIRTEQYPEEPINVSFTVRRYWHGEPMAELAASYHQQRERCKELVDSHILPSILLPLSKVISGN